MNARRRVSHVPPQVERATRVRMIDLISRAFGFGGGYATIAEHLSVGLEARGIAVRLSAGTELVGAAVEGADVVARSLAPDAHKAFADAVACVGAPATWAADRHRRVFGFAKLEADLVSPLWASTTVAADEIWAANDFSASAFEAAGARRPIVVTRPGVDGERFSYRARARGTKLRFLQFATRLDDPRKGADLAVAAFKSAFPNRDDVELTLRTTFNDAFDPVITADRRIVRRCARLTPAALAADYHAHDALLYPSRFEAVGLIPLEAIATGMPVIFGVAAGLADLADLGLAVPTRRIPAMRSRTVPTPGAGWFEPSFDALVARLREVDTQYDRVQTEAKAAAEAARERFSWDAFTEAVVARLA